MKKIIYVLLIAVLGVSYPDLVNCNSTSCHIPDLSSREHTVLEVHHLPPVAPIDHSVPNTPTTKHPHSSVAESVSQRIVLAPPMTCNIPIGCNNAVMFDLSHIFPLLRQFSTSDDTTFVIFPVVCQNIASPTSVSIPASSSKAEVSPTVFQNVAAQVFEPVPPASSPAEELLKLKRPRDQSQPVSTAIPSEHSTESSSHNIGWGYIPRSSRYCLIEERIERFNKFKRSTQAKTFEWRQLSVWFNQIPETKQKINSLLKQKRLAFQWWSGDNVRLASWKINLVVIHPKIMPMLAQLNDITRKLFISKICEYDKLYCELKQDVPDTGKLPDMTKYGIMVKKSFPPISDEWKIDIGDLKLTEEQLQLKKEIEAIVKADWIELSLPLSGDEEAYPHESLPLLQGALEEEPPTKRVRKNEDGEILSSSITQELTEDPQVETTKPNALSKAPTKK